MSLPKTNNVLEEVDNNNSTDTTDKVVGWERGKWSVIENNIRDSNYILDP